jgi:phosphate transport system ATP-binding protein
MTDNLIQAKNLSVSYDGEAAVKNVNLDIPRGKVTAFIGPSGCGKSTLLRVFNRMNDTIRGCRVDGHVRFNGYDVYDPKIDVSQVRRRVGMVFQKPNPFPKSIYENVAYGPRIAGIRKKAELDRRVRDSLRAAALWDEVSYRLDQPALGLSGGQQQRLCIARALAMEPEVLLMDEPTSALDPMATARIEELIGRLVERLTVIIVTHNMQQARRLSDRTAFFYLGDLIEEGETKTIFDNPQHDKTRAYVSGDFG